MLTIWLSVLMGGWWVVGGFDWAIESWNDFMYYEINSLKELNNDYLQFLKLKETILNNRNADIIEYKRQITELTEINDFLKGNLNKANNIILELENQLYESGSESVNLEEKSD